MTLIDETAYRFEKAGNDNTLLFSWKPVQGIDTALFKKAISEFAQLCSEHRPDRGVIDARQLDQTSSAIAWLRGAPEDQNESYDEWWGREILPVYMKAGLTKLAVATGDPNAPGEIPLPNPNGAFRMAYFHTLDDTFNW